MPLNSLPIRRTGFGGAPDPHHQPTTHGTGSSQSPRVCPRRSKPSASSDERRHDTSWAPQCTASPGASKQQAWGKPGRKSGVSWAAPQVGPGGVEATRAWAPQNPGARPVARPFRGVPARRVAPPPGPRARPVPKAADTPRPARRRPGRRLPLPGRARPAPTLPAAPPRALPRQRASAASARPSPRPSPRRPELPPSAASTKAPPPPPPLPSPPSPALGPPGDGGAHPLPLPACPAQGGVGQRSREEAGLGARMPNRDAYLLVPPLPVRQACWVL